MEIHIAYCKLILKLYGSIIDLFKKELDDDTWMLLLKVFTGIVDYFINDFNETIGNDFLPLLLDSIFSIYIRSGIEQADFFESFFARWCNKEMPLMHWYELTKALTIRIIEILCDTELEKEALKKPEYYEMTMDMTNEHLIYVWFKFFTMFGRVSMRENYKVGRPQIECLMKIMKMIYEGSNQKGKIVSRNSKIESRFIASNTLKESIMNFLDNKAESLRIIGLNFVTEYFSINIFNEAIPLLLKFLNEYKGPYRNLKLALSYNKLTEYYNKLNSAFYDHLIKEIIDNNTSICYSNQYGMNLLITPFLKLIHRLMDTNILLISPIETSFKLLLQISNLSSLYNINHWLPNTDFVNTWMRSSIYLKQIIDHFLLTKESLKECNEVLYWLSGIHIVQSKEDKMKYLVELLYKGLSANLLEGDMQKMFYLLEIAELILNSFVECNEAVPDTTSLISYLLDIIDKSLNNDKLLIKNSKPIVVSKYEDVICKILRLCMLLGNMSTTFSYINVMEQLKNIASKCPELSSDKEQVKESYKIMKNSALAVFDSFCFTNKKYVATHNLTFDSTIFNNIEDTLTNTITYLANGKIITVKESHTDLLITIRDYTGVFSYRGQMLVDLNTFNNHNPNHLVSSDELSLVNDQPPNLLNSKKFTLKPQAEILDNVIAQVKAEEMFIQIKNKYIRKGVEHKDRLQTMKSRMCFNHLKVLDNNLVSLIEDKEQLKKFVQELDLMQLKTKSNILLLYITEHGVNINTKAYKKDLIFTTFIGNLGKTLNKDHVKTGRFNHIKKYIEDVGVIYSSNYFHEQLFLCLFMHFKQSKSELKISNLFVVWNKQEENIGQEKVVSHVRKVTRNYSDSIVILITPIKNGLFLINLLGIIENTGFYCK